MEDENGQRSLWNGSAGQAWVDTQALLDGMFKPFEEMLSAGVMPGERVLDIGCGTGAITLACARKSGAACLGVDISEPMLELACRRAQPAGLPVQFCCADAQRHAFSAGSFDRIVSRFGVMFFDDPVTAFTNIQRAAVSGAMLHCHVWRSPEANPFMTAAERAARPMLPDMPVRKPDGPGQFAFADAVWIRDILSESGWRDIEIMPLDIECTFPETALETYLTRMGPLGLVLQQADRALREQIMSTVRSAFLPYVHADEVRFTAACWSVVARAA